MGNAAQEKRHQQLTNLNCIKSRTIKDLSYTAPEFWSLNIMLNLISLFRRAF